MGVYGLWRLLDASGKPVPLESLEGKILAIDVSIWIYQILQGYQDRHGAPRPNAHLLGLFTRICKLLYYKIKPIFVFDGGVPLLKKNTIASRRKQKSVAMNKAQKMKADLINNLIKHSMVKTVLNKESEEDQNNETTPIMINLQTRHPEKDMFTLPDMPSTSNVQSYISDNDSDTSVELSPRKQSKWMGNIHNVDVTSSEFKALPADVRYDILNDLKETRKQNSWGRLHEMPEESQDFSSFQLKRLLKRRYVQESLESAEKEMGGKTLTLEELNKLLTEQGVNTKDRDAFRIAADSTTRLIYISEKNALAKNVVNTASESGKNNTLPNTNEEIEPIAGSSNLLPTLENMNEYELNNCNSEDLKICNDAFPIIENINECMSDSDWVSETDIRESQPLVKRYFGKNTMNPALTYLLEYSGLSQEQIMYLIKQNKDENHKISSVNTKLFAEDICLKLTEDKKPMNDEPIVTLIENCKEVSKSIELQETCTAKDNTISELILFRPESNNLIEIEPPREINDNAEISDVTIISNITNSNKDIILDKCSPTITKSDDVSDSDSEDFIEIQDVPILDVNIPQNIMKKKDIEITIKSDEKIENDIFADIFEKADKDVVMSCSKQTQSISTNDIQPKISMLENSDNLKRNLLDPISEELINEKRNIDLENTQLAEDVLIEEVNNVHNSGSSSKATDQDNTASQIDLNEYVKEKPAILLTSEKDLVVLKGQLENEQEELTQGIGKLERQATNISDQIRSEAQELLRLFGIPYVVAPMEAEAQCAYLEKINLTDGTITDDSDIWLFGAQCVYKNFFNNNKNVLRFHACDIQHHFKLTRDQMIQLALLVGSDYTTGIAGIGPVTALEVLAAFPAQEDNLLHGLHNFCSWIKKGRVAGTEKTGLRNKLRNVRLNRDFPSQAVVQAYLFPTIDESEETFSWGKPNVVLLCDYTRQKFGWTKSKFDNTILPVLRKMEESKNQKLLDSYFKQKASPRSIESSLSKRVQKALHRLDSKDINEMDTDKNQPKKLKKDDADQKLEEQEKSTPVSNPSDHQSKVLIKTKTICDMSAKSVIQKKDIKEYIPQREKDKACALKKKLYAIEVFRKSKQGLAKTRKMKRTVRKIKKEAELSESDSN